MNNKEFRVFKPGEFTLKLPYGSYTLKQLTTTNGYEYAKDYKLNIDIDGKVIKEVLLIARVTDTAHEISIIIIPFNIFLPLFLIIDIITFFNMHNYSSSIIIFYFLFIK